MFKGVQYTYTRGLFTIIVDTQKGVCNGYYIGHPHIIVLFFVQKVAISVTLLMQSQ